MWCKLFMIQTIRNAFFKSMAMTNYIANEDQKEMEPEEVCVKCVSHSVMSDSLQPHGLQPTRPLCPWDFPGKKTGVGCHFLLQGMEPASPALSGGFFTAKPLGLVDQNLSRYCQMCLLPPWAKSTPVENY